MADHSLKGKVLVVGAGAKNLGGSSAGRLVPRASSWPSTTTADPRKGQPMTR